VIPRRSESFQPGKPEPQPILRGGILKVCPIKLLFSVTSRSSFISYPAAARVEAANNSPELRNVRTSFVSGVHRSPESVFLLAMATSALIASEVSNPNKAVQHFLARVTNWRQTACPNGSHRSSLLDLKMMQVVGAEFVSLHPEEGDLGRDGEWSRITCHQLRLGTRCGLAGDAIRRMLPGVTETQRSQTPL
jgi:hypothetical protein